MACVLRSRFPNQILRPFAAKDGQMISRINPLILESPRADINGTVEQFLLSTRSPSGLNIGLIRFLRKKLN